MVAGPPSPTARALLVDSPGARPGRDPAPITVLHRHGQAALVTSAATIDALADRVGARMSARSRWLVTWARHNPDWVPWLITVAGPDGSLAGVLPLARRRRAGFTRITSLGHGTTDVFEPAHDRPVAARALGDALVAQLRSLPGPWHLSLRQVLADDPVLTPVLDTLTATATPGMPAPTTRFDRGRELASYTSRNYRSQANHKWNRLTRDGHDPRVVRTRRWDEIRPWLPAIERAAVKRDLEIAGRSRLDDPAYARFFRDLLESHARAGELELGVLVASGAVAAYSISFVDRGAYRQWNKHHDSDWAAYRPGQVLDARLLGMVLADPTVDEFDWMAGAEPYKLRTATDVVETVHVTAAGGGAGWLTRLPAAKQWARDLGETHDAARWAWDRARQVRRRWRDLRR